MPHAAMAIQNRNTTLSRLTWKAKAERNQVSSRKYRSRNSSQLSPAAALSGCSPPMAPDWRIWTHSTVSPKRAAKFRMPSMGPGNASDATR